MMATRGEDIAVFVREEGTVDAATGAGGASEVGGWDLSPFVLASLVPFWGFVDLFLVAPSVKLSF